MDIYELITIITETPEEIADQALEEYRHTYGENDAVTAGFQLADILRKEKASGTP